MKNGCTAMKFDRNEFNLLQHPSAFVRRRFKYQWRKTTYTQQQKFDPDKMIKFKNFDEIYREIELQDR